jgi:hypothetical protein
VQNGVQAGMAQWRGGCLGRFQWAFIQSTRHNELEANGVGFVPHASCNRISFNAETETEADPSDAGLCFQSFWKSIWISVKMHVITFGYMCSFCECLRIDALIWLVVRTMADIFK